MQDLLAPASPYRGEDRRQRAAVTRMQAPRTAVVAVGIGLGVMVAIIPVVMASHGDLGELATMQEVLRILRSSLFTAAGLMWLLRADITGHSRPALVGVAMLVLGVFSGVIGTVTPLLDAGADPLLTERAAPTVVVLVAAILLLASHRLPSVDTRVRPLRALLVVTVAVPVLAIPATVLLPRWEGRVPAALAFALVAAVWLAMTVAEARQSSHRHDAWLTAMACYLAMSALVATAAVWQGERLMTVSRSLAAVAAAMAVCGARSGLRVTLRARSEHLLRLTVKVHDHERRERTALEHEQERLHEVRNVLAGLLGATSTLRKYEDRVDPAIRHRLEAAVTAELNRLAAIVDPESAPDVQDVDLSAALSPVVLSERQRGAVVRLDVQDAVVRGRAHDVATIGSALLVNARTHAPGSNVLVHAERGEGEVRVWFEDRGPGIPLDLRNAIFERNVQVGANRNGDGLGLFTARRLAEGLGGTLEVRERGGGGSAFVLTLPSPVPSPAGSAEWRRGAPGRLTLGDGRLHLAAAGQTEGRP